MTDCKVYPSAHVDRPDNRGRAIQQLAAVVINLHVGKSDKAVQLRFTVSEARLLAEKLLSAARTLEEHP